MIYKLTLLKDLPCKQSGFSFYLRGNKVSDDGIEWSESYGNHKDVCDIKTKADWVKMEDTSLQDSRPHLSEIVKMPLYTVQGILDRLVWKYTKVSEGSFQDITCCGEKVHLGGFLGVDNGYCAKCGKAFQDMSSFVRTGNSTMGMLNIDSYQADDGRVFADVSKAA